MTNEQEVMAALLRLERTCRRRPELRALGDINGELLRKLFSDRVEPGTDVVSSGKNNPKHLTDSIPILRQSLPQLDNRILSQQWVSVCEVLCTREGDAARRLADAVENGSLRVPEQLTCVLLGAPEKCREQMASLGLDPALGFTILRLCGLPCLSVIAKRLNKEYGTFSWTHGYCPCCGSQPLLAELRGLEQLRWLRCGWCAGQWQVDRLYCASCGNRNHRELRELVIDGQEGSRLTVCDLCGDSLPTLSTLEALTPPELLVAEMETLHLRLLV
jgi:hypothetical protein